MKYSASECAGKKSALLVEIKEKHDISITPLPIKPIRDMRRIRGKLADLLDAATRDGSDDNDYLHVTLTDQDEIYDVLGRLRTVFPNIMTLGFDNARTRADYDFNEDADLGAMASIDMFDDFYAAQNGAGLSPDQRAAAISFLRPEGSELE
jgi:exonuclease SbcD